MDKRIKKISKRAYRVLNIQCYARLDIRIDKNNNVFIIEANANPCLAKNEDFGEAAAKFGIPYNNLIQKIVSLAFQKSR